MKSPIKIASYLLIFICFIQCKLDETAGRNPPEASFTVQNNGCTAPCNVAFTNASKNADSYSWDFGDGSPNDNAPNPEHLYQNPGTYKVVLTASASDPSNTLTDTVSRTVTVVQGAINTPAAAFTVNKTNCTVPCEVTITNASANATAYAWDFGDGNTGNQTASSFTHSYQQAGTFIISMIASGSGLQDTAESKTVIVENPAAPTASFLVNPVICNPPCEITLTNTSTNGSSYTWDFGDGTSFEKNDSIFTYTYNDTGTYNINMIASNITGTDTADSKAVNVTHPLPTASFTVSPQDCFAPCTVTIDRSSTDANSFEWNFGDGSGNKIENALNFTHTYTKPLANPYIITMTASGPGGNVVAQSKTVKVNARSYSFQPVNWTQNKKVVNVNDEMVQVQLKDDSNNGVAGVNIKFEIISGGGSIANATTNSNGIATTTWNWTSSSYGQKSIKASVDTASAPHIIVSSLDLHVDASLIRDLNGREYRIVNLANSWWMADNLCTDIAPPQSCPDGSLYYNSTVTPIENGCDSIEGGGWHTATRAEWESLTFSVPNFDDLLQGGISGFNLPGSSPGPEAKDFCTSTTVNNSVYWRVQVNYTTKEVSIVFLANTHIKASKRCVAD